MVENETPERQPRRREVGITATYCIYDDALIDGTNDSSGRKTGALVQYDGNNPPSTPPSSSTSRSPSVYYFRSDGTTTATITTATATANGEHDELVEETKNEIIRFGLPEGVDVHNPGKPRPGDVSYSGMHDQGPLPRLNEENGPMSALLNATHAAKTFNDQFMTKIIQKEKERNNKKT